MTAAPAPEVRSGVGADVLYRREVPGHRLTVPDGPTSVERGCAPKEMFRNEKAAYNLIRGAVEGVKERKAP